MVRMQPYRPVLTDMDHLSPWQSWGMWQGLQEGVRFPELSESPYIKAKNYYEQYMTVALVVMALGIITIAGSAILAFFTGLLRRS